MTDNLDSRYAPSGLPLLSIVIPVWNVADYLGACLSSVIGQSFRDVEIIAVEGASTDSSLAILTERAKEDSRLTVIHRDPPDGEDRVGPGRARNIGMACAKGEYIWFVDGDDAIAPDCLAGIASRLTEVSPDVLFVGHERVFREGDHEWSEGGHDQHLLRPEGGPFTLAERPAITGLSMASWNKVVRREFLLSTGEQFLDDWPHEDIPVSCAELVKARSIATLSVVCYRYRQDRRGSAMMIGSTRHFNVFSAWQSALTSARTARNTGDPAVTPEVYAALFGRSVWHLTNIFDKGSVGIRWLTRRYVRSGGDRRRFFALMQSHYAQYKPPGYSRPPGLRGIKFRLVEDGAYRRYLMLAQLNGLRLWADRFRRRG